MPKTHHSNHFSSREWEPWIKCRDDMVKDTVSRLYKVNKFGTHSDVRGYFSVRLSSQTMAHLSGAHTAVPRHFQGLREKTHPPFRTKLGNISAFYNRVVG